LTSYLQPEFSQNLIHRQTEIDERIGKYVAERIKSSEAFFITGELQFASQDLGFSLLSISFNSFFIIRDRTSLDVNGVW
jgi:hypothetical protein